MEVAVVEEAVHGSVRVPCGGAGLEGDRGRAGDTGILVGGIGHGGKEGRREDGERKEDGAAKGRKEIYGRW